MISVQQVPDTLSSVCPLRTVPEGYTTVRNEDLVTVNTVLLKLSELKPHSVNDVPGIRIRADDLRACIIITIVGCTEHIDVSSYLQFTQFPSFCDAYITMKDDVTALVVELYTARHPTHGKSDAAILAADTARVMDAVAIRSASALQNVIAEAENLVAEARK